MMMMNATTPTMIPMSLGSMFFALLAPVFQVIKYMIVRCNWLHSNCHLSTVRLEGIHISRCSMECST